ncbi:MAG: hypothetical protein HWD59_05820 [Coxiellaceae bacterium]|nr:MAG: hypothetical protein HWD59_05820 [Coxiellaceae bacterium]
MKLLTINSSGWKTILLTTIFAMPLFANADTVPSKVSGTIKNFSNMKFNLSTPVKDQDFYTKLPSSILMPSGGTPSTFILDWMQGATNKSAMSSPPSDMPRITYIDQSSSSNTCTVYFTTYYNGASCWASAIGTGKTQCAVKSATLDEATSTCNVTFNVCFDYDKNCASE